MVWCPVPALKWYLHRSHPLRIAPDLFITTTSPYRPASKAMLSRWLVEAIKSAGSDALSSSPPCAHDTRSLLLQTTSWALFNGLYRVDSEGGPLVKN